VPERAKLKKLKQGAQNAGSLDLELAPKFALGALLLTNWR
jgi:hypothetical protein